MFEKNFSLALKLEELLKMLIYYFELKYLGF